MTTRTLRSPFAGTHACAISDHGNHHATFAAFLYRGLERNQRAVWLASTGGGGQAPSGLAKQWGVFEVRPAEEVYVPDGTLEPEAVIARLGAEIEATLEAGYTALRVAADTRWLLDRPADQPGFVEYEQRVNRLFDDGTFVALCHYDRSRAPSGLLEQMNAAHPVHVNGEARTEVVAGTCRVSEDRASRVIRLSGEVDLANARSLSTMLDDFTRPGADLHVDASALRFIDISGARALVDVARRLGEGYRLVLHRPTPILRLLLSHGGWAELPYVVMTEDTGGES